MKIYSNHSRRLSKPGIMALVLVLLAMPGYAQDDFFDEMLSVSDQELEATSEEQPEPPQPEVTPEQIDEMQRTIEMLTPLEPMPVTPNIPPVSEAPVEAPAEESSEQVEILLEEPPLTDDVLQQTEEAPLAPIQEEPMESANTPMEQEEAEIEEIKSLSEEAAEVMEPVVEQQTPSQPEQTTSQMPVQTWSGSIMFTDEEYRILRQAISFYERRTGRIKAGLDPLEEGTEGTSRTTSPSFYLGSIAYVSREEWAVWLNNVKYTHEKPQQDVTIAGISPDKVQLIWNIDSLDITAPNWRSKMKQTNSGDYVSEDDQIRVNNSGTEIMFILRPNQSFLSSKMDIVEGHEDSIL